MAASEIERRIDYARTTPPHCVVERRLAIWLFVASACVMLLLHNGGLSGLDGETAYQTARSVVDQKRLDVGRGFNTTTGIGGRQFAKSNLGLPLLAGVVYLLTSPVASFDPAHSYLTRTAIVGARAIPAAGSDSSYFPARFPQVSYVTGPEPPGSGTRLHDAG